MVSRDPALAAYDWRGFGHAVRAAWLASGTPQAALARAIGVTPTDLSRAASGVHVSAGTLIAICDWMRHTPRDFYRAPAKSNTCTSPHVEHFSASRGAPEASPPAAPAGLGTSRDAPSGLRPLAERDQS